MGADPLVAAADTAGQSWENPASARADRLTYPCYGHVRPAGVVRDAVGRQAVHPHGRDRLPSFLATEILFLEIVPIELFGAPIAAIELGAGPDDVTHLDVYKEPPTSPPVSMPAPGPRSRCSPTAAVRRGRLFSEAELARMGTPVSLQVAEAAAANDHARLLAVSAGMDVELVGAKDPIGVAIAGLLSWIAWHFGEAAAEEASAARRGRDGAVHVGRP